MSCLSRRKVGPRFGGNNGGCRDTRRFAGPMTTVLGEGDGGCLGAVTEFKPTAVAPEDVCELYECHFGGSQRWSSSPRMSPHGSTRQRLTQASPGKRVTVPWT